MVSGFRLLPFLDIPGRAFALRANANDGVPWNPFVLALLALESRRQLDTFHDLHFYVEVDDVSTANSKKIKRPAEHRARPASVRSSFEVARDLLRASQDNEPDRDLKYEGGQADLPARAERDGSLGRHHVLARLFIAAMMSASV